jgi:two-component system response regulator FlrC
VLLVEESDEVSASLSAALASRGVDLLRVWEGDVALEHARACGIRSVLLDVDLLGVETADLIAKLKGVRKDIPIIALANGAPEGLLEEVRRSGVVELLRKPVAVDALVRLVIRHGGIPDREEFIEIETHGHRSLWSEATRAVYEAIRRAAGSDAPLLITGETGTGKEVAARTAHEMSARRRGPFVAVNCPALSAGLMESELFGHEKGAFTNATSARIGRFEAAKGGTLLLDEVSELDSGLQAKLLRVLQERTFERVGSNDARRADVRVIATSNRHLDQEVAAGRFRLDLYHRLKVFDVRIPPLRERRAEVSLFANCFAYQHGISVSSDAIRCLREHGWPGNIRELENLIERLGTTIPGRLIEPRHLPEPLRSAGGRSNALPPSLAETDRLDVILDRAKRRAIEDALAACEGSQVQAARMLGVARSTLRSMMVSLGMAPQLEPADEP